MSTNDVYLGKTVMIFFKATVSNDLISFEYVTIKDCLSTISLLQMTFYFGFN